ncbi:MAG: 2-hydroxyacid dehydrogenase [Flavobacteriales bacterium AspAUS03]
MKILQLDENHPYILWKLRQEGFICDEDHTTPKEAIEAIIAPYEGIILRSRFTIDRDFVDRAQNLKFIARVGSGLENIDVDYARERGISLLHAPEGNRYAVAEHVIGSLLCLMNHICRANKEVRQGKWIREGNRGVELMGKAVGIIGYGHTGRALARRLSGFDTQVFCYDILSGISDDYAQQVSLKMLFETADMVSLHVPYSTARGMVDSCFIDSFRKPFYLINASRGGCVVTDDLVIALKSGKILGACLDVLEYEKTSFEALFHNGLSETFQYLIQSDKVILTPHIAGWTYESKYRLAQCIVEKILTLYQNPS